MDWDDPRIFEALGHLITRTEKLTEELKLTIQRRDSVGIGVFLNMLDAKVISESLEFLHQELNIRPEFHKEINLSFI